jgi:hypothetical protein
MALNVNQLPLGLINQPSVHAVSDMILNKSINTHRFSIDLAEPAWSQRHARHKEASRRTLKRRREEVR